MKLTKHTWILGERIDGGGFGKVYEVRGDDGFQAVAKLVPKDPGADRELLFANLDGVRNVIPIIDQGEDGPSWVLVMPKAEKSLSRYLVDTGGRVNAEEAIWVLSDIAAALTDLDGRVVHRDLKPDNVLLLDGKWCLADFGISRYAEATTGSDTRKYAWTPRYAAPEQWRLEHATSATDVYAFGVIAYQLLTGATPFSGPDFRDQHLHAVPAQLEGFSTALSALVEECLYKAPQARPRPREITGRLARAGSAPASEGLAQLQQANRAFVLRRSEDDLQESVRLSEEERRAQLAEAANLSLTRIADALGTAITDSASSASRSVGLNVGWTIRLNQAELRFAPPSEAKTNGWGSWTPPAFTVIAHSELNLKVSDNRRYGYKGRSHSIWYCDAREEGQFQWYETAFMSSPLVASYHEQDPFALPPGEASAKALGHSMAEYQVAWPFSRIFPGELDEFISRWAGWLAAAAQGRLSHPSMMPEREPRGSWR
jgi:serine/threonine protein kinase